MTSKNIGTLCECCANIEARNKITLKDENGRIFEVNYKLVRLEIPDAIFVAVAECNGEIEGVCLGGDAKRAEYIFSLVCEHGVMPGVLSETVRDAGI